QAFTGRFAPCPHSNLTPHRPFVPSICSPAALRTPLLLEIVGIPECRQPLPLALVVPGTSRCAPVPPVRAAHAIVRSRRFVSGLVRPAIPPADGLQSKGSR